MSERLADLDELTLRCRDEQARAYIAEAVASYRSGAYRASIVATWIAVAFDFVNKLRELDLAGDAEAHRQVERINNIHASNDVAGSLKFEREILELADKKFELLSHSERKDLDRLHEDRNRCAHPSLQNFAEPYQPTAELARYHIRNAVAHLLAHPPVQGRAALDQVVRGC